MSDRRFRFPTETFLQLLNLFQPSTIRYCRRVFVNRNLRMSKIEAVGFDMDYTLAIYRTEFDRLSWDVSLRFLVDRLGFPEDVLGFAYDPGFGIRGLVIDMNRGNLFKMDAHRHVGKAFHGTRPIPYEERNALYRSRPIHISSASYALVDTLFSLPETHMFALMVDYLDAHHQGNARAYQQAYRGIRLSMDTIHNDGSLKSRVVKDFTPYVDRDVDAAHTLERFIYSGWAYTDAVMSFLFDGVNESFPRWTDYFELVVVEAGKPGFFTSRKTLEPVPEAPREVREKVFRGGSLGDLQKYLVAVGDKVLYIGDHIYGDMLKSKKTTTWRTAMVVPEMEPELDGLEAAREDLRKLDRLFDHRLQLEVELNYEQRLLMSLLNLESLARDTENGGSNPIKEVARVCERNVATVRQALARVEKSIEETDRQVEARFNPHWGMLFKEGTEHSTFGEQVEAYACVYTSRVSNFLAYSPLHYFRSTRDVAAHEREE
jgi:HAD superfamily 5'-nucleotidase-like hydrolase